MNMEHSTVPLSPGRMKPFTIITKDMDNPLTVQSIYPSSWRHSLALQAMMTLEYFLGKPRRIAEKIPRLQRLMWMEHLGYLSRVGIALSKPEDGEMWEYFKLWETTIGECNKPPWLNQTLVDWHLKFYKGEVDFFIWPVKDTNEEEMTTRWHWFIDSQIKRS